MLFDVKGRRVERYLDVSGYERVLRKRTIKKVSGCSASRFGRKPAAGVHPDVPVKGA